MLPEPVSTNEGEIIRARVSVAQGSLRGSVEKGRVSWLPEHMPSALPMSEAWGENVQKQSVLSGACWYTSVILALGGP